MIESALKWLVIVVAIVLAVNMAANDNSSCSCDDLESRLRALEAEVAIIQSTPVE